MSNAQTKQKQYLLFLITVSLTFALTLSYLVVDTSFTGITVGKSFIDLIRAVIPSVLATSATFLTLYTFIYKQGINEEGEMLTIRQIKEDINFLSKSILETSDSVNRLIDKIEQDDEDLNEIAGTWIYILDPKKGVDVYGMVTIVRDGDTLRAYGDAWYFGGPPTSQTRRGTWDSVQFFYDKNLRKATILYNMNIMNGTDVESSLDVNDYTGLLVFSLRGDQFFGYIANIGGKTSKAGYCKAVKLTYAASMLKGRNDYTNAEIVNEFRNLMDTNILEKRSVENGE
jgi:hypothetical protein